MSWVGQAKPRQERRSSANYEAAATKFAIRSVGARFMRGELLFADKKHDEASREFQH